MTKNRKLSKAISHALERVASEAVGATKLLGWGMFCTMLKYKAEWEGKAYVEVDRFFPSSKTCSHCYHKIDELPLSVRSWQCPKCDRKHDRDVNAAANIRSRRSTNTSRGTLGYCSWTTCKTNFGRAWSVEVRIPDGLSMGSRQKLE